MRTYLLKRRFRDGMPGLIVALHAASSVFRTRAIAWEMQNCVSRDDLERAIVRLWHVAEGSRDCHNKLSDSPGKKKSHAPEIYQ